METSTFSNLVNDKIWSGPVIDCDVHVNVPSLEAIFEHLDDVWVEASNERGFRRPPGLNLIYPPALETTARREWRPADGTMPASSIEVLARDLLDPCRVERAIINCYYAVDSVRHPDWGPALARAVNDWLIKEFLDKDSRLSASLVIPARDAVAAAEEIDRVGGHPGFVQVLLPVRTDRLYGQRVFWPMFEAMERHKLVAGLHWGGLAENGPTPTGYASWYVEEYAEEPQLFGSQMTSMIIEGLFQKFPGLRVSMLEGGFTWLPTWSWNMNKKWKGLRRDFPWVDRLPTEIIRDHFRFSIAPADLGPPEQMERILRWLNSEDLLMYASDYPHLHTDELGDLLSLMSETMRANVMSETARRWYGF